MQRRFTPLTLSKVIISILSYQHHPFSSTCTYWFLQLINVSKMYEGHITHIPSLTKQLRWGRPCMVVRFKKIDFHCAVEWFNLLVYYVLNISVIQCIHFKKQLTCMVVFEIGVIFWRTFVYKIFCNITQEPQELQKFNCVCGFIGKCDAIKYH